MSIAYLDGEYLPLDECKVSVLDRGFIFGDAIYELIPVYNAQPFHLDEHLQRLERSLAQVKIPTPSTDWVTILETLIEKSAWDNLYVYIQVTRGVAPRDHAFPASVTPTVFAMVDAWPKLDDAVYKNGLTAITVDDMRWDRCDIKVTSLLANVMKKQQAIEAHAHEALFIRNGFVLEGSATNIFVVQDGRVFTAPKDNFILPGITRNIVIGLLNCHNIPLIEQAVTQEQLRNANEIWITSSTKECLPITTVDGKQVADGKPGELWKKVFALFQEHKNGE